MSENENREQWLTHPYTQAIHNGFKRRLDEKLKTLVRVAGGSTDPKVVAAERDYTHYVAMVTIASTGEI